jgi:heterodisulfide reductase subunit C2
MKTEMMESRPAADAGKGRILIGDRGDHFLERIEGATRANVSACYQCERCTNACPVAYYMDIKPHQVIRHIQLGWRDELLGSSTIWVCLSCETCSTYCPNSVGVAEVIIYLRSLAAQSTIEPKEKQLAVFHETFLKELQRFGRVNELWLMAAFNLQPEIVRLKMRGGALSEEMRLGWTLWRKGKLKLFPRRCKGLREIQAVYRQGRGELL